MVKATVLWLLAGESATVGPALTSHPAHRHHGHNNRLPSARRRPKDFRFPAGLLTGMARRRATLQLRIKTALKMNLRKPGHSRPSSGRKNEAQAACDRSLAMRNQA